MGKTHPAPAADPISRRDFLRTSAAAGLGALGGGADPRNTADHWAVRSRYVEPYAWLGSMYVPSGHSLKLVITIQSGSLAMAACHERA